MKKTFERRPPEGTGAEIERSQRQLERLFGFKPGEDCGDDHRDEACPPGGVPPRVA